MLRLRRSKRHFAQFKIITFLVYHVYGDLLIMSIWLYRYSSNLASNNKRVDLFDGPAEEHMEENVLLASSKASKNLAFFFYRFSPLLSVYTYLEY